MRYLYNKNKEFMEEFKKLVDIFFEEIQGKYSEEVIKLKRAELEGEMIEVLIDKIENDLDEKMNPKVVKKRISKKKEIIKEDKE